VEEAGRYGGGEMTPESVLHSFRKKFRARVKKGKVEKIPHRMKHTNHLKRVWFEINRKDLKSAVAHLRREYPDPHFSVCSGYDAGKDIIINYHFSVNYANSVGEILIVMKVKLPKKDPTVDSITRLMPGALISEREMQEMLGVKIKGVPDSRRLFLDESFPEGVFPWRKDSTGPHKLIRRTN
jgi:membrane-bound hydrogenase subunit beta